MAKKVAIKEVKKENKEAQQPQKIMPLMSYEGQFFQELVNASNRYADLLKQEAQIKYVVQRLQSDREKIQKGEIKLPVQITLIPKLMSYEENDKKKVLAIFDEQIKTYQSSLLSLKGQIDNRYDDYLESAARNKEFIGKRFQNAKAKNIVPLRDIGEKDEEVLFESEFKDLLNNPEKKKEFQDAKKEAIKRNTQRKVKKQ